MSRLLRRAAPAALVLAGACSGGADGEGEGEVSREEAAAQAENIEIRPGEWETVSRVTAFEAEAMPPEQRAMMEESFGQPTTLVSCITPEQAANPQGGMFTADERDECSFSRFEMSGGRMLVDAECQGEGMPMPMTLRMEGSYTATSYALTTTMTMEDLEGGTISTSGAVEGRRIGECAGEP